MRALSFNGCRTQARSMAHGDGTPRCVRPGRCERSHVFGMGQRDVLERARGQYAMHGKGTLFDLRLNDKGQFPWP